MAAAAGLRPAIASARRASASPWPPRRQSRAETRRLCSGSPECTAAVLAPAPPSPSRAEQRREAPRGPPPRPGSIEGGRVDKRRRSGLGAVRRGSRAEGRPRGAGAILPLVTSASSSPESSRGASPRAGARAEPRSPAGAHRARRGSSRGEPARGPGKAGGGGGGARPVGEQADGGDMGEELARCGSNAVEVRLKEKLTCGPHTSVREGREVAGGILDHTKIHGSASGSKSIKDV
ncbi:translation initiation factor IF-2-like [Panicum virgatum]|uniref:translation initiation factor IF-2-like n=1 Tax=Panicum virgatum TaxID=38727 RepID=UPI0019D54FF0|nr:translation initiation factor IF-2-like [Panicum virgatum]